MRRMLIVDDQRDMCDLLEQFFSTHGFAVHSVFSGEEALQQLEQDEADVILLDILLPGLSGLEVLRRVKEQHPAAQVIMVSGLNESELRQQAKTFGAAAYVTKPFDFSDTTWSAAFADPS